MFEIFKKRNNHSNLDYESYDCNRETQNCIDDCKRAAGIYFDNRIIANENTPLSSMDIFYNVKTAFDTCLKARRIFNNFIRKPGVDVYLKYQVAGKMEYPNVEKVKLGNLCCYNSYDFQNYAYYNCDERWDSNYSNFDFELYQWSQSQLNNS
jgi:hypothetical protein